MGELCEDIIRHDGDAEERDLHPLQARLTINSVLNPVTVDLHVT